MFLLLGDYRLTTWKLPSKMEADKVAQSSLKGSLRLGESSCYQECYYAIRICHHITEDVFCIVLFSETGEMPSLLSIDKDKIAIGYNRNIALFNFCTNKLLFEKELYGTFFFAKHVDSKLIVITEVGFVTFDMNGEVLKSVDTDLVTAFEFYSDSVILHTESGDVKTDMS